MTKPSYEELRITKHSGSPQIADSARGGKRAKAAKETRKKRAPIAHPCVALDWQKNGGEKDYISCSVSEQTAKVRLSGLLLSFDVWLCKAHQKYFDRPPQGSGWGQTKMKYL